MKPILFIDFDGTLCYDRFWRSLGPELMEKIQVDFFHSRTGLVRDWMLGKYTSEEINHMLAEELGTDYDTLWSLFVSDCKKMFVSPELLNKIQDLRGRYTAVLITDNMDCFDRFTVPALGLDQYFDLMVNSCVERTTKSDDNGNAFLKLCKRYQSPITESILLDNSISICQIFESLGGKACLVTKEKPLANWLLTV